MSASNTQQQWRPQIAQIPQDGQERMTYIRGLMRDGRMSDAQAELQALVQQEPQNPRPRMALAFTHLQADQLDEAANAVEEVMRLDQRNAFAPLLAAAVGMRANKPEYAETHFQKALQINPTSEQALRGLAQLHDQQRKPEEALKVLNHALTINPHSPQLRQQIARALAKLNRPDEAQKHLEFASETNPDDVRTTMQLARHQSQNGKPAAAVWTVETALSRTPDSRPLLQMLGNLKTTAGDYAGAETALNKVLEMGEDQQQGGPSRVDVVKLSLVRTLIPQKKFTEARAVLSQIKQRNLMRFVHQLYGDCFAAEARFADAETSYRAAVVQMTDGNQILSKIDESKGGKTGQAVLNLYADAFKAQREAMQAKMQERFKDGMRPEDQKAMRDRFRQRAKTQQAAGNAPAQAAGATTGPQRFGRFRAQS